MAVELPVFGPAMGYGIVVGLGAAFAIVMVVISWALSKYMGEVQDSEMMMTAKRSIHAGLIASAVVSSWTIGSTLLLSATSAYSWGISAPYFYGAYACVQIILFATASIELKRLAPNAHTFQELVRHRYGKTTHILMCSYSLIQQITYSANLLINGSSIVNALTGINRDAAIALFPIGVIAYTLMGGIKATFLTDWTHTVILYVLMLMFMFSAFVTSDIVGSPGKLWKLLTTAGQLHPIAGNEQGSYLTFNSNQGGLFGLVLFGAGWAASVDSQLFQKAIASHPESALGGYVLGGIAWFTIPFCLATTLGLVCAGAEHLPSFVTYPERMSAEQVGAGLVLPFGAITLLGSSGAAAVILMVFMAVTAAFSSETVAVSALLTYDVYQAYFDKSADGKKLVKVGHIAVVIFGVFTIGLAIGLAHAGFDVSFITTVSGIVVDVCVVPMAGTLFWKHMSKWAFIFGTTVSSLASIGIWLGVTHHQSGTINLTTLSTNEALAAGNICAIGIPLILVPIITYIKPDNFDFGKFKEIRQVDDRKFDKEHGLEVTTITVEEETSSRSELGDDTVGVDEENEVKYDKKMKRTRNMGIAISVFFLLFYVILFPMPLFGSKYIFSKRFFVGWIVVAFLWAFFAAITITLLPIFQGWRSIVKVVKAFFGMTEKVSSSSIVAIDGVLSSANKVGTEVVATGEKNMSSSSSQDIAVSKHD